MIKQFLLQVKFVNTDTKYLIYICHLIFRNVERKEAWSCQNFPTTLAR